MMLNSPFTTVRSSKDVKRSLLRRAFAQNRGAEVIQKILERTRRVKNMPEGHNEALALARRWDETCNSQAVRKLNFKAHEAGAPVEFIEQAAQGDRTQEEQNSDITVSAVNPSENNAPKIH